MIFVVIYLFGFLILLFMQHWPGAAGFALLSIINALIEIRNEIRAQGRKLAPEDEE